MQPLKRMWRPKIRCGKGGRGVDRARIKWGKRAQPKMNHVADTVADVGYNNTGHSDAEGPRATPHVLVFGTSADTVGPLRRRLPAVSIISICFSRPSRPGVRRRARRQTRQAARAPSNGRLAGAPPNSFTLLTPHPSPLTPHPYSGNASEPTHLHLDALHHLHAEEPRKLL